MFILLCFELNNFIRKMLLRNCRRTMQAFCFSIAIFIVLTYTFTTIISNKIPGAQAFSDYYDQERLNPMRSMFDTEDLLPEVGIQQSGKRFKLYEKKKLNHEKAKKFCKKKEGSLAQAKNIEEMRRIQALLMKAQLVAGDIWVGADKKEWKKHSSRMLGMQRPDLGPHATMLGGGPTQMCPALSSSTRSLIPSPCYQELPFVCEFATGKGNKEKVKKKVENDVKPLKSTLSSSKKNKKLNKIKSRNVKRDEMRKRRRKREIVKLSPQPVNEMKSTSLPKQITITTLTLNDTDNDDTISSTTVTSETGIPSASASTETTTNNDENSTAAHYIGFLPHIVHIVKAKEEENKDRNGDLLSRSNDVIGNNGQGHNSSNSSNIEFHVKVSTKLTVEGIDDVAAPEESQNIEITDNSLMQEDEESKIGTSTTTMEPPTLLVDTLQLVLQSQADLNNPDEAMLDLINEQSEMQSLDTDHMGFGINGHNFSLPLSMSSDFYVSTMLSNLESTTSSNTGKTMNSTAREGRSYTNGNTTDDSLIKAEGPKKARMAELEEETEEVQQNSTNSYDVFQDEPFMKNISQSLLEPTLTIQLNNSEQKHKEKQSHKNESCKNGSLLSPLSDSQNSKMKTTTTEKAITTSTTSKQTTTAFQAISMSNTISSTVKSEIVQRSIITSAAPTTTTSFTTSSTSTKPPTIQETQETTSVNNPSTKPTSNSTKSLNNDLILSSSTAEAETETMPSTTTVLDTSNVIVTSSPALQLSTEKNNSPAVKMNSSTEKIQSIEMIPTTEFSNNS